MKNKWIERFGDSRMLFAIDSVSWKVYEYSYIWTGVISAIFVVKTTT